MVTYIEKQQQMLKQIKLKIEKPMLNEQAEKLNSIEDKDFDQNMPLFAMSAKKGDKVRINGDLELTEDNDQIEVQNGTEMNDHVTTYFENTPLKPNITTIDARTRDQ